jgi:nucleoside-diphosphate-sugar epimerase
MKKLQKILVVGGAGYVGARLVPQLLSSGYAVRVLDLFMYGDDVFDCADNSHNLEVIKGDMRDAATVRQAVSGIDAIIHLACISNDPSFELDPNLGKSINYECFPLIVQAAKQAGVKRFIYASSSSVYGVKDIPNVTEETPLEPLTDYSKYKALCEEIVLKERSPGFAVLVLRPATVCGYSKRLRLDLTVNILTTSAVVNNRIKLFGGSQMRPNIHIDDICDLYERSLEWSDEQIDGKVYNAGYENRPLTEIAAMVKEAVGSQVEIVSEPTSDLRSYHISSDKIASELGFKPKRTISDAIQDLIAAFQSGQIHDPMNNVRYYNIKTMQALGLK